MKRQNGATTRVARRIQTSRLRIAARPVTCDSSLATLASRRAMRSALMLQVVSRPRDRAKPWKALAAGRARDSELEPRDLLQLLRHRQHPRARRARFGLRVVGHREAAEQRAPK